jgi:hypothetical protein
MELKSYIVGMFKKLSLYREPINVGSGGRQILFVGDLLQLPPVVKGLAIPITKRMITRFPCWNSIQKLFFQTPQRYLNLQ